VSFLTLDSQIVPRGGYSSRRITISNKETDNSRNATSDFFDLLAACHLSAEPDRCEDRQRLLNAVLRDGFATGHRSASPSPAAGSGSRTSRCGTLSWAFWRFRARSTPNKAISSMQSNRMANYVGMSPHRRCGDGTALAAILTQH
jgi:hypothetical protein